MKKLHEMLKAASFLVLTLAMTSALAATRGEIDDAMKRDGRRAHRRGAASAARSSLPHGAMVTPVAAV